MAKIDRRVIRTRQLLRDALMALILEKGYEAVTVLDITERANLGRATFYLHYKDKEELLIKSLEQLFDELVATLEPKTEQSIMDGAPIRLVFEHAAANRELYLVLLGAEGSGKIYRQIQAYMVKDVTARFLPILPEKRPFSNNLLANHLAGSLLNLVLWWLENEMPHPPTEMVQIYRTLTFAGLISALEIKSFADLKL